ncbi:MAG: glutaredoxin domain-containing protein [Eubacteriales bacterium]|nr:glutaredoxin domain-containing protein [Eubacteriales bacterium]
MIKIYASPHCIDCRNLKRNLDAHSIPYDYVDVTASMPNLKEFLALRDTDDLYQEVRSGHTVGIPTIVREDHSMTLDWEQYLRDEGIQDIQYEPETAGSACSIDGKNC